MDLGLALLLLLGTEQSVWTEIPNVLELTAKAKVYVGIGKTVDQLTNIQTIDGEKFANSKVLLHVTEWLHGSGPALFETSSNGGILRTASGGVQSSGPCSHCPPTYYLAPETELFFIAYLDTTTQTASQRAKFGLKPLERPILERCWAFGPADSTGIPMLRVGQGMPTMRPHHEDLLDAADELRDELFEPQLEDTGFYLADFRHVIRAYFPD